MGIDILDINFRLEKAFSLRMPWGQLVWREQNRDKHHIRIDPTVGEIYLYICEMLRGKEIPIPEDSWDRVVRCISDALGVDRSNIHPHSHLVKDLGAT